MDLSLIAPLLAAGPGPDITPVDAATSSVVGYWLSFGAIGIIALVLFWLYVWPGKLAKSIRDEARADLLEENQRLRGENDKLAAQRDEALNLVQEKLLPMLASFTATTSALLPLLQDLVRRQERRNGTQ